MSAPHPPGVSWPAMASFALATVLLVVAAVSYAARVPETVTKTGTDTSRRQVPAGSSRPALAERTQGPSRAQKPALAARSMPSGSHRPRSTSAPESIRIPVLGIDQKVVELGIIGTSLQVPDDYGDIGWWRDGPKPGDNGAAVMVGHVDSLTGPAVFYQLSGLQSGDRITVTRKNRSKAVFEVDHVTAYPRTEFPSAQVYRSHGAPALHLVTCGGSFDASAGHYTGNVVVFAPLVQRVPAPTTKPVRTREQVLGITPRPAARPAARAGDENSEARQ